MISIRSCSVRTGGLTFASAPQRITASSVKEKWCGVASARMSGLSLRGCLYVFADHCYLGFSGRTLDPVVCCRGTAAVDSVLGNQGRIFFMQTDRHVQSLRVQQGAAEQQPVAHGNAVIGKDLRAGFFQRLKVCQFLPLHVERHVCGTVDMDFFLLQVLFSALWCYRSADSCSPS